MSKLGNSLRPLPNPFLWASLVAQMAKNLTAAWETWLDPWLGRSPGGGHGYTLQYSCLENHYGQKSLVGYSPWSFKESDITERHDSTWT